MSADDRTSTSWRDVAIQRLVDRRAELRRAIEVVDQELGFHRVKCPTCRCRILPAEKCFCCAGRTMVIDENEGCDG